MVSGWAGSTLHAWQGLRGDPIFPPPAPTAPHHMRQRKVPEPSPMCRALLQERLAGSQCRGEPAWWILGASPIPRAWSKRKRCCVALGQEEVHPNSGCPVSGRQAPCSAARQPVSPVSSRLPAQAFGESALYGSGSPEVMCSSEAIMLGAGTMMLVPSLS